MNDGLSDDQLREAAFVEVLDLGGQVLASSKCRYSPDGLDITGLPGDLCCIAALRIFDDDRDLIGTLPARRDGLH